MRIQEWLDIARLTSLCIPQGRWEKFVLETSMAGQWTNPLILYMIFIDFPILNAVHVSIAKHVLFPTESLVKQGERLGDHRGLSLHHSDALGVAGKSPQCGHQLVDLQGELIHLQLNSHFLEDGFSLNHLICFWPIIKI